MRFKVVVARGRRRHQRCIGKLGLTLQRPEMKWSLKVEIDFSDALVRCTCGGTSW